jgi:carboxymethylenebutenolidase
MRQTNSSSVLNRAFVGPSRQTSIIACLALLVAAFLTANESVWGQTARPELIGLKNGELELKGFIWKPSGDRPFPALLWNHGSEKNPGTLESVAPYFVEKGYVFFVPHRRGQGRSPGPYIMDELNALLRDERSRRLVELHEIQLQDQMAGLEYLQNLTFIARNELPSWVFPLAESKRCWPSSADRAIASP